MLLRNEELIPIPESLLNFVGNIMLLGPRDARNAVLIILILAGFGWLNAAQLMRGMVLSLKEQTFVEASRSLGASNYRIIMRDMIPNAMARHRMFVGLAGMWWRKRRWLPRLWVQDPIPTWGTCWPSQQFCSIGPGCLWCRIAHFYLFTGVQLYRDGYATRLTRV